MHDTSVAVQRDPRQPGDNLRGSRQAKELKVVFWAATVLLGAAHAWFSRQVMWTDGVSYLDMGEAYWRGDWHMALNASWSPFYSWLLGLALLLLKPTPSWEFPVAHLVNFLVFLVAARCFHFFLNRFMAHHRLQIAAAAGSWRGLAAWAWPALGFSLFLWSSLELITLEAVTPDMCVAALVYLAGGLILAIRTGSGGWLTSFALGAALGLAYLAKVSMFPLAFIFLGVSLFSESNLRRAAPRFLLALLVFLAVAGPFLYALSKAKGRLTIGDAGKLNQAWHVNGTEPYIHWQGQPPSSGVPRHPTRKIFDKPAIYEFASPIGGTYPPLYDPSYWYEGLTPYFLWKEQLAVLWSHLRLYGGLFFRSQAALVACISMLFFLGQRRRLVLQDIAGQWALLIPALAALGMYSLVHVEGRYIGPFLVLLWMGLLASVRLPRSPESRRLSRGATVIAVFFIAYSIAGSTRQVLEQDRYAYAGTALRMAGGLSRLGVRPGDKVASIGLGLDAAWARLARTQVIAEIPPKNGRDFWEADASVQSRVFQIFASLGAKVIVAQPPPYVSTAGWQRLANTKYHAYRLSR